MIMIAIESSLLNENHFEADYWGLSKHWMEGGKNSCNLFKACVSFGEKLDQNLLLRLTVCGGQNFSQLLRFNIVDCVLNQKLNISRQSPGAYFALPSILKKNIKANNFNFWSWLFLSIVFLNEYQFVERLAKSWTDLIYKDLNLKSSLRNNSTEQKIQRYLKLILIDIYVMISKKIIFLDCVHPNLQNVNS